MNARLRSAASSVLLLAVLLSACSGESEQELLVKARQHLASADLDAAAIELRNLVAKNPESPEGRLLLGTTLLMREDAVGAEPHLRRAMELRHDPAAVVPPLARAVLLQGKSAQVIEQFGQTDLKQPAAMADLQSTLARAHAMQGQRDAAQARLKQALALDPTAPGVLSVKTAFLLRDGQTAEAIRSSDELVAAHPKSFEAWLERGHLMALGGKDHTKAIEAYRRALELQPRSSAAHFGLLGVLLATKDVAAARTQYAAASKLLPNRPQMRFFEAQLAYLDRDLERAKSLAQALLKVMPKSVRALTFDGMVQLELDAPLLAEVSLAKAVNLAPDEVHPRKLLAHARIKLGNAPGALTVLERLLAVERPSPEVLALAGDAYVQMGDIVRAEQYYRQAVNANPDDLAVRTAAAVAKLAKGDADAAFSDLQQLAAKDPTDLADMAMVSARMSRGEWDQALRAIEGLAAKTPRKALAADLAGRVHAARKQPKEARASFERAVQLDPLYFPAVASLAELDLREKKPDAARARFQEYLKRNPKNANARFAYLKFNTITGGSKADLMTGLTELVRSDPTFLPARHALIRQLLSDKQPKQALSAAQEAANVFPDDPEMLDLLGTAQFASQDLQQALSTYGRISTLRPRSVEPLLRQADIYVVQRKWDSAEGVLRRALEIAPGHIETHRRLGAVAVFAKEPGRAVNHARALQARLPAHAAGYLFEAEAEAGRKNWPAVIAALRRGLAQATVDRTALAGKLYTAYVAADKKAEAESFAATWLGQQPNDAALAIQLGEFWLMKGDWALSERYFVAASAVQPKNASVLNNLAWLLMKQKKPGALDRARSAVALAPEALPVQDTLVMALSEAGQLDEAVGTAKKLVDKAPNAPLYRLALARLYVQTGKPALAKPELEKLSALGDKFSGYDEVRKLLASLK
jgi:putative PEP-CTERM system TPR-repeat lipoprotein